MSKYVCVIIRYFKNIERHLSIFLHFSIGDLCKLCSFVFKYIHINGIIKGLGLFKIIVIIVTLYVKKEKGRRKLL